MARKMRDSGIEWIGKIPDDWELRKLKYILRERNEKNDPVKTTEILSLTASQGVIPYAEKEGGGNRPKEDLSAYKLAYPDDIVMNSMNVLSGSVGLSKYHGCVSPVYYMLYSDDENIDIRFYNYIFKTKAFQRSLMGLGNGILIKESENGSLNTIRMRIPMEKLNGLFLVVPDIYEQKKIVEFLDEKIPEIDAIIKKTKETIEVYKKYKQAVITEVITQGLDKTVLYKTTDIEYIEKIPAHWNILKLRFLGSCQNGISKGGEFFGSGYPFVSYGDVYKNYELPEAVAGLVESTDNERETYSVKYGDVFFTRTSETIEEVGFTSICLNTIENAVFAGFVIRFRPFDDTKLDPHFSKYYFRSDMHRRFFVKEMNLVTRASLSQELLKKLPVLLPPLEEQKQIARYLDDKCSEIDTLIAKKEEFIVEMENYKKSLIYEYVTGKKEVSQNK